MQSIFKKNDDVKNAKRQSDRLKILKTKVVAGPGKKPYYLLVLTKEDETIVGGSKSKKW